MAGWKANFATRRLTWLSGKVHFNLNEFYFNKSKKSKKIKLMF